MRYAMAGIGVALALSLGAVPASAQQAGGAAAPEAAAERKFNFSKGAVKPIQELQAAVNAKDAASIPAKLAAAQAAATNQDDKYVVSQLQLKAAVDAKDDAAIGRAIEAMLASGGAPQQQLPSLYLNLGKIHFNAKQYDRAASAFERAAQLNPSNIEATALLAEAKNAQGHPDQAVTLLQKALASTSAAGQKPKQDWYKRAVALAYEHKLPATVQISRDWVAAYPTPTNWRDALLIYRNFNTLDEAATLDVLRLARATGALSSESDIDRFAYMALAKGYPAEAHSVLEEAVAANSIDRTKSPFRELIAQASTQAAGERENLDAAVKTALAAPAAKPALTTGDLLYGLGEYARAAELYRAALGKTGADASLINLHLGMALAQAGDRAGATAAFNSVTGPRAELAKFWLAYLASRA